MTALLCNVFLLLEVADDDGQGQGHGESSTDGTEGAHQLAQTTHGVDVAVTETFQIKYKLYKFDRYADEDDLLMCKVGCVKVVESSQYCGEETKL